MENTPTPEDACRLQKKKLLSSSCMRNQSAKCGNGKYSAQRVSRRQWLTAKQVLRGKSALSKLMMMRTRLAPRHPTPPPTTSRAPDLHRRYAMAALASVMSPAAAASRGSAFMGARLSKRAVPMTASRARVSTVTRAGAGETLISVEKPLGVTLKASNKGVSGGVEVASAKGNAAKAGLKSGDYIVYCSSFFGDELWPADQLGFVRSAIQACPNQVDFIVVRDPKILATVDVKRLPKRPSPPRFGKKLSAAQKERASHICVDCGFVCTCWGFPKSQDCLLPLFDYTTSNITGNCYNCIHHS